MINKKGGLKIKHQIGNFIVSSFLVGILVVVPGCRNSATETTSSTITGLNTSATMTTTIQNQQPLEILYVGEYSETEINPAGPPIEIRLKNVSVEPIISLTVVLTEAVVTGGREDFKFDFAFTSANPLLPGETASVRRILIMASYPERYSLKINGIFQNGATFNFTTNR